MNDTEKAWTGMLPVDDTALAVTDTGGSGTPVVYLNGSYGSRRHWRPVVGELGAGWRHVTYDERGRGRSGLSADYSFEACVRDLDAVLTARGIARPLLVGWSYGALLGVHWAVRHPDRVAGVVGVDGPYPTGWTEEADLENIRRLFRKARWLLPVARLFGNAGRMSGEGHVEIAIEAHRLHAELNPVLDAVTVPVRYVVASGEAFGSSGTLQRDMRKTLDPVLLRNPRLTVAAKAAGNHGTVVRKDFRVIAGVVRDLAGEVG
ncbi:alpha/beta hydrolase [Phytomonospora endophytica]|uniref:Pimeloyl-ACP methyl ester carboxylesterase n=1 Tax=Phytomonospora endophytica TaxID=714109 RepID=A0A841FGZ5_9ACTN|nr:alpha/beta fold hydrolase [Phytomonospora endophytica]MBB6035144.1 pimeloyl-ACP methyl ester carboxylesterase [Phytomonospora endophytica]